MGAPRSLRRRLVSIGALVLVAVAWTGWLRPTALGGSVSYVVVQGESMEPTYEDGDLVLVREESTYRHGDVIAFRAGGSFDDPTRIIHRIVGDATGDAFATQGDNRDVLDPWEPGPDDIIGSAFLHLPMVGDVAGLLTRPASFAALGGAAVAVGGERRRRRRRVRPPSHAKQDTAPEPAARQMIASPATGQSTRAGRITQPRWAFVGLLAATVLSVPVVALAWSALRAPDSTSTIEQIGYVDYGIAVGYRFSGAPSAVYPTGVVTTTQNAAGAVVPDDPLYSRLLDVLDVDLSFRAAAEGADRMVSTFGVEVVVDTPGGWSTTLQTGAPAAFDGADSQTISIDLRAVAAQVASVAELTGVGGDAYTISVLPALELSGETATGELHEQLAAPLTFAIESNVITPNAVDAFQREALTRSVDERATYAVGPFELGTQTARGLLGGIALVLVAGIAWFASVLFGGLGLGEPARIAARYRSQIIDVAGAAAPPGPVVMVSAIDELARIAKVEQTVILHEDLGDGAHRYRVFLGTVTYEYEAAPEHAGAAASDRASDGGATQQSEG